jgi:hypothetical protein
MHNNYLFKALEENNIINFKNHLFLLKKKTLMNHLINFILKSIILLLLILSKILFIWMKIKINFISIYPDKNSILNLKLILAFKHLIIKMNLKITLLIDTPLTEPIILI